MRGPSPPEKALLFAGTLFKDPALYAMAKEALTDRFGELILESKPFEWDYSNHYREETGFPLKRVFLFFKEPFSTFRLAEAKTAATEIEMNLSSQGRRNVNIDPGYLTQAKVVLASKKNYSHRVCIRDGVYAEVTLVHIHGEFRPHLFTYNDYASPSVRALFEEARKLLKQD